MDFSKLDLNDPKVLQAIKVLKDEETYNTRLKNFFDVAYPWQKKAIEMTATHRIIGVICGNQMGKSEVTCAMLAAHLTGIYPSWWKGKKYDRPVRVMAAGVDSNHNKNVLQERLFGTNNRRIKSALGTGMIPKRSIVPEGLVSNRGDDITSAKITHSSGGTSEIIFRAYSQGREAAQGFPADIIQIDEQPGDPFWEEALTRTRATGGHIICSFTPLMGRNHLVESLLGLPKIDDSPEDQFGFKYLSDGRRAMVRASWHDAAHIVDNDPNAFEDAKNDYPTDWQARVFGVPSPGAGRIYDHLTSKIIYDPENTKINDKWESLIGIDFGWTKNDPSAMVRLCWDKVNDIIYVTEEWKGHTVTDKEFVRQVNYIDPRLPIAWPRDGSQASDWKGGGSIADKLRNEWDLNLLKDPFCNPIGPDGGKNNHLAPGFQEINSRFADNRLKISMDCRELISEIENYGYGKDTQGQSTGKPAKGSEDHLCDAFRYAVMTIIQGYGESTSKEHSSDDYYYNDDEFRSQNYDVHNIGGWTNARY